MKNGKKNWVFCDGDLPPHGDNPEFLGHEALMITNVSKKDAHIRIKVIFEDKPPYDQITIDLNAERTTCLRLDYPIGKERYIGDVPDLALLMDLEHTIACRMILFGNEHRTELLYALHRIFIHLLYIREVSLPLTCILIGFHKEFARGQSHPETAYSFS